MTEVKLEDVRRFIHDLFTGLKVCDCGESYCDGYSFTINEPCYPPTHIPMPVQGPIQYRIDNRIISDDALKIWARRMEKDGVFKFV